MSEDNDLGAFLADLDDEEEEESCDETFVTCRQNLTVNKTINNTVNETFFTVADASARSETFELDSIAEENENEEEEEDRITPTAEPKTPEEKRKTLTEEGTRETCKISSKPATPIVKKPVLGLPKEASKPAPTCFDPFFAFKVKTPKVSSLSFDSLIEGVKKIKLMQLHLNKEVKDAFVTMGVIVDKGETKKSANGNEYLIWKLHDLKNCQDKPVKLLLFGDACKEYWKLQAGNTVALLSPQFGDQQQPNTTAKDSLATLKVSKRSQVIEIGQCTSYGHCKSLTQTGHKCSNFVNMDTSEYCVYHVMVEARKISSKRGVFNNVSSVQSRRNSSIPQAPAGLMTFRPCKASLPSSTAGTIKAATGMVAKPLDGKVTSKSEEKEQLKQIIADRSMLPGAKNLQLLESKKHGTAGDFNAPVTKGHASMANFIQKQEDVKKEAAISRAPTLGFGLRGTAIDLTKPTMSKGAKDAENAAARLRAIAILNQRKKGLKRPSDGVMAEESPAKRPGRLGAITNREDIEKLLKAKSLHDGEAKQEELATEDRYFNGMAAREKVESFTTECMAVKNVKVVTCKKCNYTAPSQSEYCMQQGHAVQKHQAERRFFKCGACSRRTTIYGLVPTKPCKSCEATDWHRVAMRDERKVVLENEKLELRGEERKFVNI